MAICNHHQSNRACSQLYDHPRDQPWQCIITGSAIAQTSRLSTRCRRGHCSLRRRFPLTANSTASTRYSTRSKKPARFPASLLPLASRHFPKWETHSVHLKTCTHILELESLFRRRTVVGVDKAVLRGAETQMSIRTDPQASPIATCLRATTSMYESRHHPPFESTTTFPKHN